MEQDLLQEEAVRPYLVSQWVGQRYCYVAELDSTNDYLKAWSQREGAALPGGAVVVADFQRRGKGRLGRSWLAPAGSSLLCSLFFRLDWPGEQGAWLTMIAGLAAADAVTAVTGLSPALKWPNDLMLAVNGRWRKLGGILLEGDVDEDGRLQQAIVGVGINVNVAAADLPPAATPPTSLLAAAGRPVPRRPLLVALLQQIEKRVDAALAGASPQPAWDALLITKGQWVTVSQLGQEAPLVGVAVGTDAHGRLLVRDSHGQQHTITAADVTLRAD